MDDKRASWEAWAREKYSDPTISAVATEAAIAASDEGRSESDSSILGHRAAMDAGGEYRCRPNRTGAAIVVCALFGLLLVPATLAGLSTNPAPAGYLFLAIVGGGPTLGVIGLILVRRNSCFFATKDVVGRRNWAGKIVASAPRARLRSLGLRSGSWANVYSFESLAIGEMPDDSTAAFLGVNIEPTRLLWWSDARFRDYGEVIGTHVST